MEDRSGNISGMTFAQLVAGSSLVLVSLMDAGRIGMNLERSKG